MVILLFTFTLNTISQLLKLKENFVRIFRQSGEKNRLILRRKSAKNGVYSSARRKSGEIAE